MGVLVVLLLGLVAVTVKMAVYPAPPKGWMSLHEKADLPMEEVNRVLTESGARIAPVKMMESGSVETWELPNRVGMWTMVVTLKKTPAGMVYAGDEVRYEIERVPSLTRRWESGVRK